MPSVSSIAVAAAAAGGAAGAFIGIFNCARYILRRGNDRTIVQRGITVCTELVNSLGLGAAYNAANVAGIVVTGSFDRISSLSLLLPAKDSFGSYIRNTAAAQFLVDVVKKGQVSASNIIQLAVGIAAAAAHRRLADSIHPLTNTIVTSLSFVFVSCQLHQITTKLDNLVFRVVGAVGFAGGLAASHASINAYFAYIFARGSVAALEGRYFGGMMQHASRLGIAIAFIAGGTLINLVFYTFGFVTQKIGANGLGGSDMHLFFAISLAATFTPVFVIALRDAVDLFDDIYRIIKCNDQESDYKSKFSVPPSEPMYNVVFLGGCGSIFGAAAAAHMCGANAPIVAAAAAAAATAVYVSYFSLDHDAVRRAVM